MNINRKNITVLLVILVCFFLSCSHDKTHATQYKKGKIIAENFNFTSNNMPLNTEWEFYWKKLYTPADFKSKTAGLPDYIKVPGVWNGYVKGDETAGGDGFSTYRLVVKNLPAGNYALKIPTMATAYKMWINSIEAASNGSVAPDKSMVPMQKPDIAFFNTKGEDVSIIVQVSNYMSDKGGIWAPIYLGEREQVLKAKNISISLEMMLLGAFIIMSLYHFAHYAFRKNNRFTFYFGLLCFTMGLRVILTGEFLIVYFFPWINWGVHIRIEFITVFAGFAFFILFLKNLYRDEFPDFMVKLYVAVSVIFTLITISVPVRLSAVILPVFHIFLVAGFFLSIYFLTKAVRNNKKGAGYVLAGCIFILAVVINDILDSNKIINSVYLFPYGLLVFIFSQSVIQARIFSDSFKRVEDLSIKLGDSYRQIDEYNRNLEIKIAERTYELAEANEKLRELDKAKTDFFANVSHELRTPLTLILAPVENALTGKSLNRETLEMIRRNAHDLLSLITGLLEMSRITAGKFKLDISQIDLSEMIKQFCGSMESAARLKGINLVCKAEEPVKIYADPDRLGNIISNFFSNSFKFTEPGGVIEVSVWPEGDFAILEFKDTGCGIPEDKIDTIFERFIQADTGPNRRFKGTGIGLSIIKELVELHNGEISVKSHCDEEDTENHGTVFTVKFHSGKSHFEGRDDVDFTGTGAKLPVMFSHVRGLESYHTIKNEKQEIPETAPSILVVEDNQDLRALLVNMLSGKYFIHEASNGIEAVKILESNDEVDLVLSDVMMPGMDGYELIKWIRENREPDGLPVLFLTARADDLMILEGLKLGATDYVTKPFNPDELLLRIKNQMELKLLRSKAESNYRQLMDKLEAVKSRSTGAESTAKIEEVCNFIKENYTSDLLREDLASAAGLNPDTFSRIFNQHTGKSLSDFINELRIEEAKRKLIRKDITVTRVAIETGFENIRTFNRTFKKITGLTPGEYRQETLSTSPSN